jgi:hypothetical protein
MSSLGVIWKILEDIAMFQLTEWKNLGVNERKSSNLYVITPIIAASS